VAKIGRNVHGGSLGLVGGSGRPLKTQGKAQKFFININYMREHRANVARMTKRCFVGLNPAMFGTAPDLTPDSS
jgi:hypothetical protein